MPLAQLSDIVLDAIARSHLSLHDAAGNELSGQGYTRQPAPAFNRQSGGMVSSAAVEFAKMPRAAVAAVGFWTEREGGELLLTQPCANTVQTNAGDTYIVDPGSLGVFPMLVTG